MIPERIRNVVLVGHGGAGKTTVAKVIIRHLRHAGLRVAGTKLTGAGRYRDVLSMSDAGAELRKASETATKYCRELA